MPLGERKWWTLGADEALAELGSSRHGLSHDEARRRLAATGPNAIQEASLTSPLTILARQFQSPLIYILMVAAALTAGLGEFTDTSIIVAILVLNAVVGFLQEYRAEQALHALRQLVVPTAAVLRSGRDAEVESLEIVPGDVMLLDAGARIPADGRLLQEFALQVDESLLTGESTIVSKTTPVLDDQELPVADRTNLVYMGAVVTGGRAHAVVTGTGMATELGRIAGEIRGLRDAPTPLQQRMDRFARVLGMAIVFACVLALPLGVAVGESIDTMLRTVVALIVAAIPEGLPVVLTVTLAIGVSRMARRGAIVRTLPAVETLGSCTVIASDKTGTLTENRMTIQAIYTAGQTYQVTGVGYGLDGNVELDGVPLIPSPSSPLHSTLLAGILNNDAALYQIDGRTDARGDPTEIALLVVAAKAGIFKGEAEEEFPRIAEIPFEPDRRFSATLHECNEAGRLLLVKGAPERVLAMCRDADGPEGVGDLHIERVMAESERLAGQALRVLALAHAKVDSRTLPVDADPSGLTFLGLVGLMDPPRIGAPEAVEACASAGIRVLMLTGDHKSTASAVAKLVGIQGPDGVIEGREIENATDEELDEICRRGAVFARVAPHHKLRIVQALRRSGDVVAVTGDGVNDAPALRAADIGLAMGLRGTDVAREASSIVLTDDNFATIVAAVEEGRVVFDNVRKVTFFLLSTGIAVVIATFASILGAFPLPLLPAQIIWVNLVTNGVQDIALAFEPGEPDILKRSPRPVSEGVVSRVLWERTALVGMAIAVATVAFFLTEYYLIDASLEHARTVALTTMVLFQAIHVGNARSEHLSVFRKSLLSNRFLFIGTLVALSIHVGALYLSPTQRILEVEPLSLPEWIRIAVASLSVVAIVEIHKIMRRPLRR